MNNLTFSTCSYIRDAAGSRSKIVRKAFSSWEGMLSLPFAERVFLDDQSPDRTALHVLEESSSRKSFDRLQYQENAHPPHSNFGIVASLELAKTPYIMHLDDDVCVTTDIQECRRYIDEALKTIEMDPSLMGFNLLTLDPAIHGQDWLPGEPYAGSAKLHHPQRYYGTAACIIRRELLDRVPFTQIVAWGSNQPNNWEKLVTSTPKEFVTGELRTPFSVSRESYFFRATARISGMERAKFLLKQNVKQLLGRAER